MQLLAKQCVSNERPGHDQAKAIASTLATPSP